MSFHACNVSVLLLQGRVTFLSWFPLSKSHTALSYSSSFTADAFLKTGSLTGTNCSIASISEKYWPILDLGQSGVRVLNCSVHSYLHKDGVAHQKGCVQHHQISEHVQGNVQFCLIATAHMSHQSSHNLLRKKPPEKPSSNVSRKMPCSAPTEYVDQVQIIILNSTILF